MELANIASMRPQHLAADNPDRPGMLRTVDPASMRPQHLAADNVIRVTGYANIRDRFNEAAAFSCG